MQGIFDPASIKIALRATVAIRDALDSKRTKNGSVTIGLEDGTKITFQDVSSPDRFNFT